jgi:hypothetical protein
MTPFEGTVVYSSTGVTSAANTVSLNRHTYAICFWNNDASTDAVIKLNGGPHQVAIPSDSKEYVCIPGDYTTFQVMTANVTVSVYAIG